MSEPRYPSYGGAAVDGSTSTDELGVDRVSEFTPEPRVDGTLETPDQGERYTSTDWSIPAHGAGQPQPGRHAPAGYPAPSYPADPYLGTPYPPAEASLATGTAFGVPAPLAPPVPDTYSGAETVSVPRLSSPDELSGATMLTVPPPRTGPTPDPNPPTPQPSGRSARARGPRRARLQLRHIDPWTVLKFSCVLSIALFFVWLITIGVLYGVLQAAGVINKINDTVTTINGSGSVDPVTPGIVFGGAAIIGVVNIILFIALSTVGSIIYNLCADLVGGVEVTLSERD
ncbi:MAG: DUF3566 domain-containing protein [Actinomycetota bacterium]